ncbi:N-6 DNA methylase [Streptomyces sp. NBC_01635]|uniref:N-6 DNA methylase n=1 Tax=Streptomyces sp. NBC_01635 TaxID=2975904 RepID=UPI003864BE97|nr:N-6 DNA methylase [Streptomyces sp. NBC_01635]
MSSPTASLTISASDIAQLAGVRRSTVSNWRSRYEDFPKPVAGSAASPRFDAAEVRAWLKAKGKEIAALSADAVLWSGLDAWRGLGSPEELGDTASALITWRYVSDPESSGFDGSLPEELQWPRLRHPEAGGRLAEIISRGMKIYEESHPELGPIFTAGYSHRLLSALSEQAGLLHLFVETLSSLEVLQLGEAYEAFQDRLTNTARRGYDEHASSAVLVELMAAVASSVPGSVHDPAAGSGRMLLAVGRSGEARTALTGQEINYSAWAQANQRALVTGHNNVIIRRGDVFTKDAFDGGNAQVVVLDPAYSLRYPHHDALYLDQRFPYGMPPKNSMDVAWLQVALWHVAPQGRAFVYQPPHTLFASGATGKARIEMLRRGTIEAVISLPGGLASNTMIPLSLWVLARPGETADPDKVLLIDHSQSKDIDVQAVGDALRQWREHRTVPKNLTADAVSVAQLLAQDGNLSPARWLTLINDAPDLEEVLSKVEACRQAADQVRSVSDLTSSSLARGRGAVRMVTVSGMAKADSVRLLRAIERIQTKDLGSEGTPVVTTAWIRSGDDSQKFDLSLLEREPVITQPGDIVLQTTGNLAARVDEEGGRVLLSPLLLILRPLNDMFDPYYVAELLTTEQNVGTAVGSTVKRVRADDLKIPLLPRSEQSLLVSRLKEVRELEAAAHQALNGAASLRRSLVEAVAAGAVRINSEDS